MELLEAFKHRKSYKETIAIGEKAQFTCTVVNRYIVF